MKKDVALTREMTTEEMRRYLTSQQPRPDWLPEGYADPIRFICLCIDHGARDAIGDSLPDPQEPLSELTAQRFFRGKRILWLFNVLCEQLAFEHGNAFSGSQNTADLLSSFAFLMPLTGWNGKEIKPETLAKNYRTRFGTKKAKKGRGTK